MLWQEFLEAWSIYIDKRAAIVLDNNVLDIIHFALKERKYGAALEIISRLNPEKLKIIFKDLLLASVNDLGYAISFMEIIRTIDHTWLYDNLLEGIEYTLTQADIDLFYAYPLLFEISKGINRSAQRYIIDFAKSSEDSDIVEIGIDLEIRLLD